MATKPKLNSQDRDPVCGMEADPATTLAAERNGTAYRFCSSHCLKKFLAGPTQNAGKPVGEPKRPSEQGLIHTCPMHPEVRKPGPGSCPKCGMALEPEIGLSQASSDGEGRSMLRRFWISAALTLPVMLLAMSHLLPGHVQFPGLTPSLMAAIQLFLTTPVVLWAAKPFFEWGWASILNRSPNMFTLVAIGTGTAYGYSVVATLLPGVFPAAFRDRHGMVGVYFESAAAIVTLVLLGQVLELRARSQTSAAIKSLLNLLPKTAHRLDAQGREEDVLLETIQAGDRLRVRPGEQIPADGIVLEGSSAVDESMISGEASPVKKAAGEQVTGATLNGAGSLLIRAGRVGQDTLLAQIVRIVRDAQRSRAPIARIADSVAAYFVPAVVAVSLLTFAVWASVGPQPRLPFALINAIAVLMIACPCALGLAVPMSIMVGTGRGALSGILIRDAAALEALEKMEMLVVDKTGTLTEGHPRIVSIVALPPFDERALLQLAAAVEQRSEHPLAWAIRSSAQERGMPLPPADHFESLTGEGVRAAVKGRRVIIGSARFLEQLQVDARPLLAQAQAHRLRGETAVFVAVDGRAAGLLGILDPIKPSAREAVAWLHRQHIRIVMLTGDHRKTAEAIAAALSIDDVQAEILPHQKRDVIARLQAQGRIVGMAGDGINDAPALAQADIGIAMGGGSDIAKESAAITLMHGDLRGIMRARKLSQSTMKNIRQNLLFAFLYNVLGVPVAAGVLYPFFGLLLSPVIASAAMTFSSVCVIANALRLRKLVL